MDTSATAAAKPLRDSQTSPSRKDQIVAIAMDLFAEKGFQAVSVREIAEHAGILSGSLYTHFSSKQELLDLGLKPYAEVVRQDVLSVIESGASSREKLTTLLTQSFARIAEWHAAAAVMYREWEYLSRLDEFAYLRDFNEQSQAHWVQTLREAVDDGTLASDVDPTVVWRILVAIMEGVAQRYNPKSRYTLDMTAEHLLRMLFGGLGPALPERR